jgi:flavin reductase (DIM6/NTAB) family NADH-FMN oxidoreductase RutF
LRGAWEALALALVCWRQPANSNRKHMYYEPGSSAHGLQHDPFKSCVVPRPIGWIATVDERGNHNLAPYSQFQNVTFDPPIVMFSANQNSDGRRKDSVRNAEQTGEFVWNMATWDLRDAVNVSAQELPPETDEFELAGLEKAPSRLVKPMRVARSPIQFECVYLNTLRFPGNGPMGSADVVFGRVVAIHIADDVIDENGLVDVLKIRPIARMGYFDYTSVDSIFSMTTPGEQRALLGGLEGSAEKVGAALKR